jgi:hypothetical protein
MESAVFIVRSHTTHQVKTSNCTMQHMRKLTEIKIMLFIGCTVTGCKSLSTGANKILSEIFAGDGHISNYFR